jgi:Flp pilus assembly protein TadD
MLRLGRPIFWLGWMASACSSSAFGQDGATELTALSGNSATIVVTVRAASGEPLPVAAVVRLYKAGGVPNGQTTASPGGRAVFVPQGLGDFSVAVEAPGYKTGHANVDVPVPVKVEVDVYLQPESTTGEDAGAAGGAILAPKAKAALDKALEDLRANKLEDAEKQLTIASQLAPQHPDVLYLQGMLYTRKGELAKAQATLETAVQMDPHHARALAALGTVLANQGAYAEAIPKLEESLKTTTGSWETHWTLAKAYYEQKKYEAALKESRTALAASNGKAPEIELLVAQALTAVGRYDDSAAALRNFLKNHADHPDATKARRWLEKLAAAGKIQNN